MGGIFESGREGVVVGRKERDGGSSRIGERGEGNESASPTPLGLVVVCSLLFEDVYNSRGMKTRFPFQIIPGSGDDMGGRMAAWRRGKGGSTESDASR